MHDAHILLAYYYDVVEKFCLAQSLHIKYGSRIHNLWQVGKQNQKKTDHLK